MTHTTVVLWAGFAIGILFGAVGRLTDFCLNGGLRAWWSGRGEERAGVFALAVAVAAAGTYIVAALGYVDLGDSLYYQRSFSWLAVPLGGVLFGVGMILAGGCGSRALVMLGDGNLRSLLVVLCLGLAASMTLTGLLANPRLALIEATSLSVTLPEPSVYGLLAHWGAEAAWAHVAVAAAVCIALAALALFRFGLVRFPGLLIGSVAIGLLIPAGWVATGHLGADDFEPVAVESLTFVAPVGDTLQYAMLSTGVPATFGVTVVAGVVMGSLAASLGTRRFAWRGFDSPRQMMRLIAGGALMGIGGALALGCSIGQGLTGFSTLSLASLLAVAGILAGAWLTLRLTVDPRS